MFDIELEDFYQPSTQFISLLQNGASLSWGIDFDGGMTIGEGTIHFDDIKIEGVPVYLQKLGGEQELFALDFEGQVSDGLIEGSVSGFSPFLGTDIKGTFTASLLSTPQA